METKQKLILGQSIFDKLLEANALIIDKSFFIRDFINHSSLVCVIHRPRRFGKSTNLSMLQSFLSLGGKPEAFSQLAISKNLSFVQDNCGAHPVICLDMKDCNGMSWEEMHRSIWYSIQISVVDLFDNSDHELLKEHGINFNDPQPPDDLVFMLFKLTKVLFKKHGKQSIILIDEYDTPINKTTRRKFKEEAAMFFKTFHSCGLENNKYLKKACLVGIIEVSCIFSGINNIKIFSIADMEFSQNFGFSAEEIAPYTGDQQENVLAWYGGYKIGDSNLVSPWAFMSWLVDRKFKSYWVDSAGSESISDYLKPHLGSILKDIIALSYSHGYKKEIARLKTTISYRGDSISEDSLWHFLINAGYLSCKVSASNHAFVPNLELRLHWQSILRKLLNIDFYEAITFTETVLSFQTETIGVCFQKILRNDSFNDPQLENLHRVLFVGHLLGLVNGSDDVNVSIQEGFGLGLYIVQVKFVKDQKALIIGVNHSPSFENLEPGADATLQQIIDIHKVRDRFLRVQMSSYRFVNLRKANLTT